MRVIWRPLAPGEMDHELLWLGVSIGALALGAIWLGLHLPWPACAFHLVTGHPCPTCGATRALIAFLHGHIGAASRWNPLAFAVYGLIGLFDLYALVVVLARARRLRLVMLNLRQRNMVRGGIILLVLVNWSYLLVHGCA